VFILCPWPPIQRVDELETAVARALGLYLTASDNIRERLQIFFHNKRILLIMDNFEHLEGAGQWLSDILATTQFLNILVTSRSSLNISAEWVRYLEGVDYPLNADEEDVMTYSAIQLFVDRVRRVRSDFALQAEQAYVVEICHMVRGMPLAIELAAAWAKTLPYAQIAREIRHNIDFLATTLHDVDPRHRSLRAVFDASWQLLTPEEQNALQRLSVFRGGFGLAAAEQVAGALPRLLAQLIDKSLLNHHVAGQYEMHELLRQYVAARLSQSPLAALSTRSGKLLAWSKLIQGEFDKAAEVAQDIIVRKSGRDVVQEAFCLALSGVLSGMDGDYERCHQLCTAALSQMNMVPDSEDPVTLFFVNLGLAAARPTQTPTWMENWPLLRELRLEIEADMGSENYAALWERGKTLDLHQTAAILLES